MNVDTFDRIKVMEHDNIVYLPRSTAEYVDSCESRNGVFLPVTYREFCVRFGPGELAGVYRIAAPIGVADRHDLTQCNLREREAVANGDYDSYGPRDVTQQCLFFCDDIGGESFVWKTDEIGEANANEYMIYCLKRNNQLRRVASTFAGFIESVLSKRGAKPQFTRFRPINT